jgi:hypothetical protein
MKLQYAMKNPNVVFVSPETLAASSEFTAEQKRAILLQWKDQLQQLLVADEESMLFVGAKPETSAECLRRVTDTMRRLPLSGSTSRASSDRAASVEIGQH